MTSTEKETTVLQDKIDAILKSKVKHNFANIETFDTMEQSDRLVSNNTTPPVTETFEDERHMVRGRGQKWRDAFKFLTDLTWNDMRRPDGWHNIFKGILYTYPILVRLIVDDIISVVPTTMEGNISDESFTKKKKHDAAIMVNTAYELGYTMLAVYSSNIIYTRLNSDSMHLQSVHKFLKVGIGNVDYLLGQIVFLYLTLSPTLLYHFLYDILKMAIRAFGLNEYPTLKFIFIFLVCYYIIHVFLDKMCEMFLQIFEFKADPSMWIMIVSSWFVRTLSIVPMSYAEAAGRPPNAPPILTELDILAHSKGLYIFVLLIHLAVSLYMAPLGQFVFVLYMFYAFFGYPWDSFSEVIREVEMDCHKSFHSNKEEILGGFDNFAYLYGYRHGLLFIMMLFFCFKTIQSAVEMKILALRTAVTTINAYITATMAVIYSAHVYFEKQNTCPEYCPKASTKASTEASTEANTATQSQSQPPPSSLFPTIPAHFVPPDVGLFSKLTDVASNDSVPTTTTASSLLSDVASLPGVPEKASGFLSKKPDVA